MDDFIWMNGTKGEIIAQLGKITGISRKNADSGDYSSPGSLFIDMLIHYHAELLSPEEEFQMDIPRQHGAGQKLLTQEAKYFIGLKKGTCLLLFAIAEHTAAKFNADSVASKFFFSTLQEFFSKEDMALFTKLSQALGESCIVLEAARNRKKGFSRHRFPAKNGECINNHLDCRLQEDRVCTCGWERAEQICRDLCDKKVLVKRGRRYFYTDFI